MLRQRRQRADHSIGPGLGEHFLIRRASFNLFLPYGDIEELLGVAQVQTGSNVQRKFHHDVGGRELRSAEPWMSRKELLRELHHSFRVDEWRALLRRLRAPRAIVRKQTRR